MFLQIIMTTNIIHEISFPTYIRVRVMRWRCYDEVNHIIVIPWFCQINVEVAIAPKICIRSDHFFLSEMFRVEERKHT
ncbi:hypothetical protein ANCCAN_13627 [Ancylostoma caninum]|uniref:Uncharacterized protein n=1 Tax=Ancylostoma caninum TaxID=29170 RepID=A0A368G7P1_ANCCA|nr:hypothetical protein ANCCAN_13627 [Ancylostoma caninum]